MYYYIFEQPKTGSVATQQNKIKNQLSFYGISGEISRVSPARSVEELTQIALAKQYNTVVAVGSDELINQVASFLQHSDCALGVIPINASKSMHKLLGIEEITQAYELLKKRRVSIVDIAYISPNKYFLTKAEILNDKSTLGTIYFDKCQAGVRFTKITLYSPAFLDILGENKIYVSIIDQNNGDLLSQTFNWLIGKNNSKQAITYLRSKHLVIDTPEPISVYIGEKIVAKTPIEIKTKHQALKIITNCAKLVSNNS